MNKWPLIALIIIIFLVGGFIAFNSVNNNEEHGTEIVADYKNVEYIIEGERVRLLNGVAENDSAPNSATKTTTRIFGNELFADVNDDGRADVVFVLTQQMGTSGTFFYAVAALNTKDGYIGTEGYFLGDRIAPQTTELSQDPKHKNVIVVNYMDRAPGEPVTENPSVGKSAWLRLNSGELSFGVVEQNFEGEADPSRMSLIMKDWTWISALYNDGRSVEPNQSDRFVISLEKNGRFSATTDCNGMSGDYIADEDSISFERIFRTEMFCEGSQEGEFLRILESVSGYHFTARGELIFELKFDSGTATFK